MTEYTFTVHCCGEDLELIRSSAFNQCTHFFKFFNNTENVLFKIHFHLRIRPPNAVAQPCRLPFFSG